MQGGHKQVRQQACKTQMPPYGLKPHCRLKFRRMLHCDLYIGQLVWKGVPAANSKDPDGAPRRTAAAVIPRKGQDLSG